jgi:putative copper export protein/mono/diheme cytochrome c family protein
MDLPTLLNAASRGASFAALLSGFGTLVFWLAVLPVTTEALPAEAARAIRQSLVRLARISIALALIGGIGWLIAETAAIADAGSLSELIDALPAVAGDTRFGQMLLLRLGLLALALIATARGMAGLRGWVTAGLLLAAVLVQLAVGHAATAGGNTGLTLLSSETLHVLAAGAWLGGLLPLFLVIGRLKPQEAVAASHGFYPVGLASVVVLAATGLVQALTLIGGLPALLGTDYGHVALLKIALFLALLGLAAANRYLFTANLLAGHTPAATLRRLRLSVATEAVLGLLVVLAAGLLASLAPGIHEQPEWPFALRPSLVALEDPDLRREVAEAVLAIGGGALLLVLGLLWRRLRWSALAAALLVLWLAAPHLRLLLVEAYPTSYDHSPTGFAAATIASGAQIYAANCTSCHGADGTGHGPAAAGLAVPPADLTASHLWEHLDGELFWWVSNGVDEDEGGKSMPGFAGSLSEAERWAVIDYIRAHNAGWSMRATGGWSHPVAMPEMAVHCVGQPDTTISALRGNVLRLIVGDEAEAPPAPPADQAGAPTVTILLSRRDDATPTPAACVAGGPEAWQAIATLIGSDPEALPGTQLLADPNGWLRAKWQKGDGGGWTDTRSLLAEIRDICSHPIAVASGGGHVHQ